MQLKLRTKFLLFFLVMGLSVFIYDVLKPNPDREEIAKWRIHLIPDGFYGHVIKKVHHRCNDVILLDAQGDSFDIHCATEELLDSAAIGDSIIKYPNSNNCRIINEGKDIQCNCYYEQQLP